MTQSGTLTITVDFNRLDANDLVWAFRDRANYPDRLTEGAAVELDDGDGNRCLGYIVRLTGSKAYIRPEWSTWQDKEPVTTTPVQELDDALRRLVKRSSADSTQTFAIEAEV